MEAAPTQKRAAKLLLRRRRPWPCASLLVGCFFCGKLLTADGEEEAEGGSPRGGKLCAWLQWWREALQGLRKRRRVGSEEADGEEEGAAGQTCKEAYQHSQHQQQQQQEGPPRLWKQVLRKLRARLGKATCCKQSLSFAYDPLSYSLNFDDGCWQHCVSHHRQGVIISLLDPHPPTQSSANSLGPSSYLWDMPSENVPS